MEPLTIFSFIVSSLIFLACWTLITPKTSKNLPPGPPKLPIIGNIHQLGSPTPHRHFKTMGEKYGPIMHLQVGKVSTIVVSTPRLAEAIMKTNDLSFAERLTNNIVSEIFFYKSQDIAWAPYGEYWRQMKKICIVELLSSKKVQSFSSICEKDMFCIRRALESSVGSSINFTKMSGEIMNNLICKATLGDCCKDQDVLMEVISFILHAFTTFNLASIHPRLQFLNVLFGRKSRWLKLQKKVDKILEDVIDEHENEGRNNHDQEDLIGVLLRIKKASGMGFEITNDQVKAVVLDLLTGGTDTSSSILQWAMAELMRNPEIKKKAQEEVRDAVKGSTVTEADVQSLHYLKLVIKETLRLHPPVPLVPRQSRKDCTIDGYDIPAKTIILVNAFACGTDPNSWEDPQRFIPERFENSPINYMGTDFQFIPFGAGRRMCPGIAFGLSTVEYILANFLYHFDWKLPDGLKPHDLDMTAVMGIAMSLKHELKIVPILKSSSN